MRKTKYTLMFMILVAALIAVGGSVPGGSSAAAPLAGQTVNNDYRGGSSFDFAGAGPNVARCGAFPQNVELSFTGSGIDTEGGYNTAVFSACTNTATNLVFDKCSRREVSCGRRYGGTCRSDGPRAFRYL